MAETWKNSFLSYEIIMFYATEQNKWEILEYHAKHNPKIFESIVRYCVYTYHKDSIGFKRKEIIAHYQNADWTKLPSRIKDLYEKTKKQLEDASTRIRESVETRKANQIEKLKNWNNEILFSIEYFDKKSKKFYQFNISSREDALLILQKYLNSSFSRSSFCAYYGITNPKGFDLLLKKISAENEDLSNLIKEKLNMSKQSYKNNMISLILSLIKGEISLDTIINNHQSLCLDDFVRFSESLDKEKDDYKISFLKKVLEYFNKRISSFDITQNSKNPQNFITNSELRFLIGWQNFKSLEQGKWFIIDKLVARKFSHLKENDYKFYKEKVLPVTSIIASCQTRFNQKEYLSGTHRLLLPNNNMVEITPMMIENATNFIKKFNLYPCPAIFRAVFRAIAKQELADFEFPLTEKFDKKPDLSNQQIDDLASFLTALDFQESEPEAAD